MKHDTSHAERVARITFFNIWIVIGAIIIASVALNLIGSLSSVLLFLSVGCLSAFVASPIVNWLERHRVPRGAGALIGLIVVMVGLILLFALVIPMVTGQLIDLLRDAPSKFSALGAWVVRMESKYAVVEHLNDIVQLDSIFTAAQDIVNQALSGLLAAVRDGIVPMVNNIASTVFIVFLGFVLAFWLACDYPRINEEICRVLPEGKADDYRLMVAVVSRSVGGYLRSTVINSVIQGFLAFVGIYDRGPSVRGRHGCSFGRVKHHSRGRPLHIRGVGVSDRTCVQPDHGAVDDGHGYALPKHHGQRDRAQDQPVHDAGASGFVAHGARCWIDFRWSRGNDRRVAARCCHQIALHLLFRDAHRRADRFLRGCALPWSPLP